MQQEVCFCETLDNLTHLFVSVILNVLFNKICNQSFYGVKPVQAEQE